MRRTFRTASIALAIALALAASLAHAQSYALEVLPPEHETVVDAATGATLVFLTDSASQNLYFHEYSWLSDGSMVIFRGARGLMGYLPPTGELVVITTPSGGIGNVTAAAGRPTIFGMRGNEIVELTPRIEISRDPNRRSRVTATARVINALPFGGQLNPRMDDAYVSVGDGNAIWIVDTRTGELRKVCDVVPPLHWGGHLQWSRSDLHHLSWACGNDRHREGDLDRIMVVDIREGVPRPAHRAIAGELVTHESWWVNDRIIYCGATREGEAHVMEVDTRTGTSRIAGAGAWWPNATPSQLAKRNWWHCAGSADGTWIAADNWYGDIMLFDGRTTRPYLLTENHRTYGGGTHPEVGWDRAGRQVIFASNRRGYKVAVIATIPDVWRAEADSLSRR